MTWMQMKVPDGTDTALVTEPLRKASLRLEGLGSPEPGLALLWRKLDGSSFGLLLLSPAAARYSALLPGDWVEAADPDAASWTVLFSAGASLTELGLP